MIIIHSFQAPFLLKDSVGPYVFVDNKRIDLPSDTTRNDLMWFRRPHVGGKNEALKIETEWEVKGTANKSYTVKFSDKSWSCNCHAFKFSGNSRLCKHINEIKLGYLS
jgi:hypothetical protein